MTFTTDGSYKTTKTTTTIEALTIYTTRIIDSRMYKLNVNIDGIEDMLAKCERLAGLDDDTYKMLADVQLSVD